jgi:hypothetical protein
VQGRLSDERAARLAELPCWAWSAKHAAWEIGYDVFTRFVTDRRPRREPNVDDLPAPLAMNASYLWARK